MMAMKMMMMVVMMMMMMMATTTMMMISTKLLATKQHRDAVREASLAALNGLVRRARRSEFARPRLFEKELERKSELYSSRPVDLSLLPGCNR